MSPTLSQGPNKIIIIILSTKQGLIHHDIIMFITFELSLDTHLSLLEISYHTIHSAGLIQNDKNFVMIYNTPE